MTTEEVCIEILNRLERFRLKLASGEITAGTEDWVVRMCQAYVADFTQYTDRASWVQEINKTE